MNVLLIDDEDSIREYVRTVLESEGIGCVAVGDTETARERLSGDDDFEVILLDVAMPGESGWDFLEVLRGSGDETPVIFLTGRGSTEERVKGLNLGADDYIAKPFEATELLARIDAVVRRSRQLPLIEVGDLKLDLARRIVSRGGRRVDVSPREFDVLQALVEAKGEVVSRVELLKRIWGIDFDPGTNVVEVQVARLRKKLQRSGPPVIETVVGKGYRASVRRANASEA